MKDEIVKRLVELNWEQRGQDLYEVYKEISVNSTRLKAMTLANYDNDPNCCLLVVSPESNPSHKVVIEVTVSNISDLDRALAELYATIRQTEWRLAVTKEDLFSAKPKAASQNGAG